MFKHWEVACYSSDEEVGVEFVLMQAHVLLTKKLIDSELG